MRSTQVSKSALTLSDFAKLAQAGAKEDTIVERYIGTIFSKQQTGFKQNLRDLTPKLPRLDYSAEVNQQGGETTFKLGLNDYDPSIKFGRDGKLFVKKEALDMLTKETRYKEDELKGLKDHYIKYSDVGAGLNFKRFKEFLGFLYNIEAHPFAEKLFYYFDNNHDGIVEYYEVVKALNIIERGNFDEKVEFCFSLYDLYGLGVLETLTLREILKFSYVKILIRLERVINKVKGFNSKNPRGLTWAEFSDPTNEIFPELKDILPIIYDRFDYNRSLVNYLEIKYKFTLDSLEQFWNIFKTAKMKKKEFQARNQYAELAGIKDPDLLTNKQFKLMMYDVFKVDDPKLLDGIFVALDRNKNGLVEMQEFVGEFCFFLRGDMDHKLALYFEVNMMIDPEGIVSKEILLDLLTDCYKLYKEVFESAKKIADAMNTSMDGQIKFDEFKAFCEQFPSAMDFLGRLTLGTYPNSTSLTNQIDEQNARDGNIIQLALEQAKNDEKKDSNQKDLSYEGTGFSMNSNDKSPSLNRRWIPRVNE